MDLQIINIAANTKNNKLLKKFSHKSKYKNPMCGDQIEIRLIVKNNKIIDIGYQSKSCIYCLASASILSNISINKSLKKIIKLIDEVLEYFLKYKLILPKNAKKLKYILNKKNYSRKECILLPFKALKKALQN